MSTVREVLRRVPLGTLGIAASLVVVWTLFWGELSAGNVASGVAVAIALLIVFPLSPVPHVRHRLRPVAVVRLVVVFAVELVHSTLVVARDVLFAPSRVQTGIIACPLRVEAGGLATFLANLLALSPGTMPIEVTLDPAVLYLHVLQVDSPDAVRARVARLEALAVAALGSDEALETIRRSEQEAAS